MTHFATEEGGFALAGAPVPRTRAVVLAESLDLLKPRAEELVAVFYERLFARYPEIRDVFPVDMSGQRDRLLNAIILLVTHFDDPGALRPVLSAWGRRHERYCATFADYAAVGETLLKALAYIAGSNWTQEYNDAWTHLYGFAAGYMMQAGALVEADGG